MDQKTQKAIIESCKELGCCDACCLRYLGLKNPTAFENSREFLKKYSESENDLQPNNSRDTLIANTLAAENEDDYIPTKKKKTYDVCVSCLGVLQEESWPECLAMVKEMIDKKRYECKTFACALSAPIATILREKAITLHLADTFTHYDESAVTSLKEAWKWSCGGALARHVGKELESGAVAPLLVTLNLEYAHEAEELEVLKALSPSLFLARSKQRRRFAVEFTRRAAEQALAGATPAALRAAGWARVPPPAAAAAPVSATGAHAPLYLGGRYVKLSRALPQTPWVVRGERVMDSSVQEIIFAPLAELYGLSAAEAEHRLKFMSAGREDVDVRCLGTGRPFALEVADPSRAPSAAELARLCADISRSGQVVVKALVPVTREALAELKRGEETKCKTYEALCIKLAHTPEDLEEGAGARGERPRVTARDVANVSAWCARGGGALLQRTPLRVLHRRGLLARRRALLQLEAAPVPGHAALLALRVRAEAGTYVKEWAHGDLRRTAPALAAALRAPADILALDVTHVHLDWPAGADAPDAPDAPDTPDTPDAAAPTAATNVEH